MFSRTHLAPRSLIAVASRLCVWLLTPQVISGTTPFSAAGADEAEASTARAAMVAARRARRRRGLRRNDRTLSMGVSLGRGRRPFAFGSPAVSCSETRGFASPPHDGFAFIGRATEIVGCAIPIGPRPGALEGPGRHWTIERDPAGLR